MPRKISSRIEKGQSGFLFEEANTPADPIRPGVRVAESGAPGHPLGQGAESAGCDCRVQTTTKSG